MAVCDSQLEDKVEILETSFYVTKGFRLLMKETGLSVEGLLEALVEAYARKQPFLTDYGFGLLNEIQRYLNDFHEKTVMNDEVMYSWIEDLLDALLPRVTRALEICEMNEPEKVDVMAIGRDEGEFCAISIPMTEDFRTLQENIGLLSPDCLLIALKESYCGNMPLITKKESEEISKTFNKLNWLFEYIESDQNTSGVALRIQKKKTALQGQVEKLKKGLDSLCVLREIVVRLDQQAREENQTAKLEGGNQ